MSEFDLSKFTAQRIEILPPGVITVEGTMAGQPAVWISSTAQIGCMCFPPPERKEIPAKM